MASASTPRPSGVPPGQQPTPEQIQRMQQQIAAEAAKAGVSIQEYVERLKQQALAQHQQQQQQMKQHQMMQQQQQQQQQQQPIAPGPPKPEAVALANFLRAQDLKLRTCLFQEKRKDMFRVKRALRALQSPAYEKARKKNALLPAITDRASLENAFKMLPLSLLALRVSKADPEGGDDCCSPAGGHSHGKQKRVKGLWTVRIEQQQEVSDDMYYMWLYEGPQWKNKLYAAAALVGVFAVVMFPLWPLFMRTGVWYLSMGMTGLLGLFFTMALFRLILFCLTVFTVKPGLWLYPNLFEDVGFWDSFKPLWAWHETPEEIKSKAKAKRLEKRAKRAVHAIQSRGGLDNAQNHDHSHGKPNGKVVEAAPDSKPVTKAPGATGASPGGTVVKRHMKPSVEDGDDD